VPDYEGTSDFLFTKEIYTMSEIIRYTPANIEDAVHPQTALHEATEAAVKTYNDSIEAAKQVRDEAVKSAQKQFELSLKEYNAAVELASRR
jgi:F0F1-type ATP synthase membrane subunit b/b'